ncbi:putative DNA modification/repair radical SAM protein [Scatolibacter rhodanostii]|uniref:putative DNA modification/repair radical SAM protein n=1 Tax=Scatolibacter rhodanostii TaxID=2014781 RepID=UPI000C071A8B|nr:putative DNA modification/repair radical SAM protein [Scatolibacter rhodanostii]
MDMFQKLEILTDAAKYDVACTSSGVDRGGEKGKIGNTVAAGICHSFAADGRCISLLKVLLSNDCVYDCSYCVNRHSNDGQRTTFTPDELCELTIQFYRRNYIEGLFLSSAIVRNPDYTCELMIQTIKKLRNEYRFNGYIHAKAIPGADQRLIDELGLYADRMSVNIELPSNDSLKKLAPQKSKERILGSMKQIKSGIQQNSTELVKYKSAPKFVPAGQSTQMIIGASDESDRQILKLSEGLYQKFELKRVFFSAYMPIINDRNLPALDTPPPLLREHRLYQADWLLRFYKFKADEILDDNNPNFNPLLDPKCNWAIHHMEQFPVEVNRAPYEMLLRVPGIGVKSALRIVQARRYTILNVEELKKLGIVLKRARFFITCNGKSASLLRTDNPAVIAGAICERGFSERELAAPEQMSLFAPTGEDKVKCLSGQI